MQKNIAWPWLAIGVICSFCSSCVITVPYYSGASVFAKPEFHRKLPLEPGGTIFLENLNGDIEISGWERSEVEIFADKLSSGHNRRSTFSVYGWRELEPNVRIDRFEDLIKIRTESKDPEVDPTVVDYTVKVPHSVNLKDIRNRKGDILISDLYGKIVVDLREGDVRIENFSGSIEGSLVRGDWRTELLDLREEDEVRVTTREGDIILYLQPEENARIEASAPNGSISSDLELNQPLPGKKLSAQLKEGKALIMLTAFEGDIKLKKGESGMKDTRRFD